MAEMRIAYFDCFAGISGDMVVGALLDLGLPPEVLDEGWRMLGLKGVALKIRKVQRGGLGGTHVEVVSGEKATFKNYREMRDMVRGSALPEGVKDFTLKILGSLARVEADIHGMDVEKVHFHEIGGVDTIVDAVGAALGVAHFSWNEIHSSPLPLNRGWIEAGHGRLPLPAPATLALLQGIPVTPSPIEGETVTPTGAAIVTSLAAGFGALPEMVVTGVGYGAGTRDPKEAPNLLRVIQGVKHEKTQGAVWVLETDVDDMTPELLPYLNQLLLREGALDAHHIPIQMKKGRPGFTIRVLSPESHREKLVDLILRESTALGVRMYRVERMILPREGREVKTRYGPIRIKVAFDHEGKIINLMPEYEICRQVAEEKKVPLKEVYQEAIEKGREAIKQKG